MNKIIELELSNENFEQDGFFYTDLILPAKDYEIKDAYHRVRIPHQNGYREITVSGCPLLPELEHMRLDSTTMEEMNFLAERLAALNEQEQIVLQAVKGKVFDGKEKQIIRIKDVINLTYGLDEVSVISAVETDEELGQFVIDNDLNEEVSAVAYESRDLLDKAKIGKMIRESEGGVFVDGKYVVAGEYEFREVYDGKNASNKEPLTDWIFRLQIAKQPIDDPSETQESAEWLALPINKEEANRLAERLDSERIEDCVYFDFESVVPQIESAHFNDMQDFDKLNKVAEEIKQMSEKEQMQFKAVLEAEEPNSLDGIVVLASNLKEYQFAPYLENASQYFVDYLNRFLNTHFDLAWFESLDVSNEGEELCERLGVTKTPYGYISGRGCSLYECVARHRSGIEPSEEFDVIELCGQTALFSNSRIRNEDVPQGLHKYELREGDGRLCTVEPRVMVNHGGTVLLKQPLQLGAENYIAFTDETSPDFLGNDMTLRAFMETDFTQEYEKNMGEIKQ